MARPKSDEKRRAILEAAARVIVAEGLGASTAGIAKAAGVANGSLFTYFDTKTALLNALYLDIKGEIAAAAMRGLPEDAELREQLFCMWRNWASWAVKYPAKRKALAQLAVSEEVSAKTREKAHKLMAGLGGLMSQAIAKGAMRKADRGFVMGVMTSIAETTMDFMTADPKNAKKHCKDGFEAAWRMMG